MQIGRDSASKNSDFPQLVLAMRLFSRECVKSVKITYLTSIKSSSLSNEIGAKSAENTTQGEMYLMSKYMRLRLNVREI